ncbi:cystathionine gamma-synthase family protein [Erythrobacter sp. W302b]|uniref:cystathionine gamma-synthase family protein n=1 Tax=Erythrobacter sp. W302b TaxID=3389874 RepID=UPI00396B0498
MRRTITHIGEHALAPASLMMSYGFDPKLSEGAIKCPVFQSSTFVFESAAAGKSVMQLAYGLREREQAEDPALIYSRINNPALEILEDRLALWDKADRALVFASGMAAISTTVLSMARPGDAIVYTAPVYGGTDFLFDKLLPQFGIRCHPVHGDLGDAAMQQAVERARAGIGPGGRIAAIYAENPANPTNRLIDLAMLADLARSLDGQSGGRPKLLVDNTMLGPLWQQPLAHGADIVIYSLTKYVGGHSDLIAGSCVGSEADLAAISGFRTILGTMTDPHTAWLLLRSLETLSLRMRQAEASAWKVAEALGAHPKVAEVGFLGFVDPASEQGRIFARQCSGAGSTFSVFLHGGEAEAFRFLDALKLMKLAVSLGGTESLASYPAGMTHVDVAPEMQRAYGISDNLVRLSIGVEEPEDLIADCLQALDQV